MTTEPRFVLVSREACHLCAEMAALLDRELPPLGERYREVDVDADPALAERYGEVVPVLLRDGVAVAKVRLDRRQLRRIVRRKK